MQCLRMKGILNEFLKISTNKHLSRMKLRNKIRIHNFLEDMITSAFLIVSIHIFILFFFKFHVLTNQPTDPSLRSISSHIRNICENLTTIYQSKLKLQPQKHEITANDDFSKLLNSINNILTKTRSNYFICYRTLYEIFRLKEEYHIKNRIDICIHQKSNQFMSFSNYLFKTSIDHELEKMKEKYEFDYTYNSIFGYYHIFSDSSYSDYGRVSVFIYLFDSSPETMFEFSTINRLGYFYVYMTGNNLKFSIESDESLRLENNQETFNMNYKQSYLETFTREFDLILPSKIPEYMVEGMNQKVMFGEHYFPVPNDPDLILMYFYPDMWYIRYDNCMI